MIAPTANLDSRSFCQPNNTKHSVNFGFDPAAQGRHLLSYIGKGEKQMGSDWTVFNERRVDVSENAAIDSQPGSGQNQKLKRPRPEGVFLRPQ